MWHLLALKLLFIIATICIKLSSVCQILLMTIQFLQKYTEMDSFEFSWHVLLYSIEIKK